MARVNALRFPRGPLGERLALPSGVGGAVAYPAWIWHGSAHGREDVLHSARPGPPGERHALPLVAGERPALHPAWRTSRTPPRIGPHIGHRLRFRQKRTEHAQSQHAQPAMHTRVLPCVRLHVRPHTHLHCLHISIGLGGWDVAYARHVGT